MAKRSGKRTAHQSLMGVCARTTKGLGLSRAERNKMVSRCLKNGGPEKKKKK